MKLFIIQYLYGYLLIILPSHVHPKFFKKALFGWGAPAYPGYHYPGYPNPAFPNPAYPAYPPPAYPPPAYGPPPGFGGLVGTLIGKFLSAKFGIPPAYPYPPAYPPPYPGPFPFAFPPALPTAIPVPVNVPVPFPVDRPYPIPVGKPSLLPPITIVKQISEPTKMSGTSNHESSNSHPLLKLFQMSPPEKSASYWNPMNDNHNSYYNNNHKDGRY